MKANCEICSKPINIPDNTDAYAFAHCGEKCLNARKKFEEKHSDDKLNPYLKEMNQWLQDKLHRRK